MIENFNGNMRAWLRKFRSDRTLCMLIPMEASICYPIEITAGREYMLPFFFTDLKNGVCYPPFAYAVASFPHGEILAFKNLAKSRLYEDIDVHSPLPRYDGGGSDADKRDYWDFLSRRIRGEKDFTEQSADEWLMLEIRARRRELYRCYTLLMKEKMYLLQK